MRGGGSLVQPLWPQIALSSVAIIIVPRMLRAGSVVFFACCAPSTPDRPSSIVNCTAERWDPARLGCCAVSKDDIGTQSHDFFGVCILRSASHPTFGVATPAECRSGYCGHRSSPVIPVLAGTRRIHSLLPYPNSCEGASSHQQGRDNDRRDGLCHSAGHAPSDVAGRAGER